MYTVLRTAQSFLHWIFVMILLLAAASTVIIIPNTNGNTCKPLVLKGT